MKNLPSILDRDDVVATLRSQMLRSRFGIKSLLLFGSVARNEATQESDLDFVVDFDGTITFDRLLRAELVRLRSSSERVSRSWNEPKQRTGGIVRSRAFIKGVHPKRIERGASAVSAK